VAGGGFAVETYSQNSRWTASIPGAEWIWKTFFVPDSTQDETETFIKTFNITSTSTLVSASLVVAADNSYTVSINGNQIGADATEFNYLNENKDTYDVTSDLVSGSNTISFTVKNWGITNSTSQDNPAGLLYKLTIHTNDIKCGEVPANTPPTITLIGANPLNLAVGTPFVDPGATATDLEDGDATTTSHIIISGTVNASTTGTYTLTYSVTDSGGLGATTTRTVNVNPVTIPPVNPPSGGGGGGSISSHRHQVVGEILGATSCSYLIDYLKIDWQNDPVEVLKLQSFLNVFEKENLSLTGVFNQETFEAVQRFQTKYSGDILEPWGDKVTTGFVYILTKKKVNEIYCNTAIDLNQADQNEIKAFKTSSENGSGPIDNANVGYLPQSGSTFTSDNSQNVLDDSIARGSSESLTVELKDNLQRDKEQSIARNAAVSLFAFPQKMFGNLFDNCGYASTLLFLILIAVIVAIIKMFLNSRKSKNVPAVSTNEDSSVVILPDNSPDGEIIIENPEEELEEINTLDLDNNVDNEEKTN
jgi:hypothetical protein